MRVLFLLLLLLASYENVVHALRSGEYCFSGCDFTLTYVTFNDTGSAPGKARVSSCQSTLRAISLYLCLDEYCSENGRDEWLQGTNETCRRLANTSIPPYSIVAEYGRDDRAALKRLSAEEAFGRPMLADVVLPVETFFERAFSTLDAAYYEYGIHRVYGWALLYFWAIVICIGIGCRLVSLIQHARYREHQKLTTNFDGHNAPQRRPWETITSLLKRHIASPATFNSHCSEPIGWCTVPPRIQSLTILSFVVLNIVLCTVDYRITHGNLYWPRESMQRWRYVSDRTGILSLANFPIIWIFGMRNNVLIWATGWGFGTYNSFHRWVARVSTVQAVVHSVGYTVMVCEQGGWASLRKYLGKHYFWNGELATISMCAVLAFSVYGLRRSHYEIFLIVHVVISVLIILTMYYHVNIFPAGEWTQFLYPCLAVWLLDRISRVVRILGFDPRFWCTKALVAYNADSHLVHMEVPVRKGLPKPKPGTYYYLHVLDNILYAHQNHPFTLAYVKTDTTSGRNEATETDPLLGSSTTPNATSSLTFLIRPYDGFTSRLAKRASVAPGSLRVLVEGPYGHTAPLRQYRHVLFIVGGTGIAVPLLYLEDLLSDESAVTNLSIVWAVREHAFLAFVLHDFHNLLQDERVSLEAHVTQDEEHKDDAAGKGHDRIRVDVGRPNVHAVVAHAVDEAAHESLAVMACGPAQMADQARRASVGVLAEGARGVDYFEESFKW